MDDRDFFSKVFVEVKSMLVGYFLANRVELNDVEELVNEVFILAWKYRNTLRDRNKVKRWVFSIAKNALRAYKNLQKKQKKLLADLYNNGDASSFIEKEHCEELLFAQDIISRLPPAYRDVFVLFYVEDKSLKEIAEILGISESNCKVRLFRAREKIKELLGGSDNA